MTMTISAKELDREYCTEKLLEHYLTEGSKVYTILRRVSASGMTRHLSVIMAQEGEVLDITYYVAGVLDESLHEVNGHRTIKQNGCGMDMGFNLIYNLSSVLFKGQDRAGYVLNHAWL